jgi:CubicO group peptidase (beta-lactamase class C family)
MDKGQIVYSEGFGMADRENSIPVDRNTIFNIGSVSKLFCAAAVMLLVDDGKVKLDDPVVKYLPDFTMADFRYQNITVRMLLDHTSGLPGTASANNFGYKYNPTTYQDLLTSLEQARLKAAPGEIAPYTNDGFTLAEILVTRVSGENFTNFLSQRIFKPLSLDHTSDSVGEQTGKNIATCYQPSTGKKIPLEVLSIIGTGGISSTAEDLVRFADSFSTNGKSILSQTAIKEMTTAHPTAFAIQAMKETGINPEPNYGLGLDVAGFAYYQERGIKVISKGGDSNDFHAELISAPEHRISVAVIEAGIGSLTAHTIAIDVFNAVLEQKNLIESNETPVSKPPEPQSIPEHYASFAGYYTTNYHISFDFEAGICNLASLSNGVEQQLTPLVYRDNYFYTSDYSVKFSLISVDGQYYLVNFAMKDRFPNVVGQKLQTLDNPLNFETDINGSQWLRRNVKPFEGITSATTHIITASTINGLSGYIEFFGFKQIDSPNHAGIPSGAVRDQMELMLINKDGKVWAQAYDLLYSPASETTPLQIGANTATISNSGYNNWFKTTQDIILSLQKPDHDRVIIFSLTGTVIYDSIIDTGDVFVPQGSFVELVGAPGDTFKLTAKNA